MNRRTFVETSVAAGLLSALPSRAFPATNQIEKVGVQLDTVRGAMKSDFTGTIAKVASIGYKEVEFAGYFNHSPSEVRATLDKNGLAAPSCHVDYDVVEKKWSETIDAAHTVGHSFIVCPYIDQKLRKSADDWKRITELFNKAGEASKKAGIQFGYHNHWWEFAPDANLGGKLPYDYLLESTDANLMKMEMDLCWISVAGQDPLTYFKRYPGRFPLVHVKDFKSLPHLQPAQLATFNADDLIKTDMTAPGSGVFVFKHTFASSDEALIQHYLFQ